MHRFNWDTTETTKKPKMPATKVDFIDNDGSWKRNKDSGSEYDGQDNDDDSDYDRSDDSDYDIYDDPDYTNENDSYNEYDTCDEDNNFDDGNDTLCALCDDGGKVISCIGQCKRSFHPRKKDGKESKCKTLGYTSTQLKEMGSFLCKNCEYKQHQCFTCGELEPSAEPNAKVFKCNNPTCGHFYHPKCVAKLLEPYDSNGDGSCELEKRIMEGMSFTCPMHWCFECGRMENHAQGAMQFATCRRCPKSYHTKCLPREISFETKDKSIEQRAWNLSGIVIIYCLDHKICRATGNAKRDHIKFPQTSNTVKVQDLAKQKGRMSKRKRSVDERSVKSIKALNKLPRTKNEHTQNSLQHMAINPEGSAKRLKKDIQIEPSMAGTTTQSSQVTVKWQKKQPRSSLSFVMRTRMLASDVGSKRKKRETSRPKKERSSRKPYNIAAEYGRPPIQISPAPFRVGEGEPQPSWNPVQTPEGHLAKRAYNLTSLESTQEVRPLRQIHDLEDLDNIEVHKVLDKDDSITEKQASEAAAVERSGKQDSLTRYKENEIAAVERSGQQRTTIASSKKHEKEEKRSKKGERIEDMMGRQQDMRTKQVQDEYTDLVKEKEDAKGNDFSIKRCISVLSTMEMTKEEKAKAFAVFIKSKENREAFLSGCELDQAATLIWLKNVMV